MNKTVNSIVDAIADINKKLEEKGIFSDADLAFKILTAAAGGLEYVADYINDDEDAGDFENDYCDCEEDDECECDDDEDSDISESFTLTTDSRGRIYISAEIAAAIEKAQGRYEDEGITVLKNADTEQMELAFGEDTIEAEEEGDKVSWRPFKHGQHFQIGTVFGPNADVVLEIYDDGKVYVFKN